MAKRNLTFMKETEINLPKIDGENDIIQSLTREDFDKLNEKNYEHVLECIDQVLKESKIDRNQLNNVILIGEGLRIPKLIQLLEEKFEDCNFITDLYNIISQGAAIYAAHWGNKLNVDKFKNFKVYDITQLSLGIRTEGDLISTILKRGSRIPVKVTKSFLTTQDNQKKIKFEVYQGERKFSKDNDLLCRIILKGISEKLRGLVEIDVTFEVNEDGILIVTANEKDKDEKAEINAFANGNMEEEDIKNLIKNAEYARKDDEEKEERVKASLRLNELILKFTALFSEDEELWAIIEEYRNWLMHAGTVPKEEYDKKRIELMRKMPRDEDFEDPKEEEKKEEEKKEEEKKNEEQKGSEVANPAA
jgi:molecular chaperone DnaK (HSP70)